MTNLKLPQMLDFETISTCNRTCPTCLRNSYPDREKASPWFTPNYLPVDIMHQALEQAVEWSEFRGGICLNHYNEPLLDERLPDILDMVWGYNQYFNPIYFHSNGDLITEELAAKLDGKVHKIVFSLYMADPVKAKRKIWIESLFHKTNPVVNTITDHIATHYSPGFDVQALAARHRMNTCTEAEIRIVINHRQQYLLCCDDMLGHFDLGSFPEISLKDYWYGEKHTKIAMDLRNYGGRLNHPHCVTCPRA